MSKTSNVFARVEPKTKEQAEIILNNLGLSMSNAVDLFLKQVVIHKGIPFEIKLEPKYPPCIDDLSKEEIDALLQEAMDDIEEGRVYSKEQVEAIFKKTYGL